MYIIKLQKYLGQQKAITDYIGTNNIEIINSNKTSIGQSNPTYILEFKNLSRKLVLRKQPEGQLLPGAHAVDREYLVTDKLSQIGFPVAKPLLLCKDTSVIGTQFYIMQFVEGRIFTDPLMRGISTQEKREILFEQARVLAQLHNINYKDIGLSNFGKPENFYQRQIQTWTRQYKLAETNNTPGMEDLIYWLQQNIPQQHENDIVSIAHGDFAINNLIFHPTQPKILAVIDWELSTIGNSFADLAYMTQCYLVSPIQSKAHFGGIKGIEQYLDLPKYEEILEVYCKARNITKQPDLRFYTVFSLFRLASIGQGVYKRALQGNASQVEVGKLFYDLIVKLSNDAMEIIKSISNNDPFGIQEFIKNDQPRWGQWSISERAKSYYYRVREFLIKELFPFEKEIIHEAESRPQETRWSPLKKLHEIKEKAKKQGLWNLFCTYPTFGKGLTNLEYAFICELMGTSIFAPEIFNCSAPDTGNMEVLILYANNQQKLKYLLPLMEGEIRSCFAMTEPDTASSDPTNLETTITKNDQGYVINGRKFYISGAGDERCKFSIVMGRSARNKDKPHNDFSMVLVDLPHPNIKIVRPMHVFGYDEAPHGHMEMIFDNVQIPKENLIWKEGAGFEIAQGRLGGGRLHHCMRLVGISQRAIDLMIERAKVRKVQGKLLIANDSFQQKIGELETLLQSCRLMVLNSSMQLDKLGNKKIFSLKSLSETKAYVPKVAQQIIDEAIQIFGAAGVGQDYYLPLAFIQARTLRIADGPDEVHYKRIAKIALGLHERNPLVGSYAKL